MSVGREMRDFAKPGSIIFMMELKDSMTGAVLARAGDSAEIPAFSTSPDVLTDWDAVEAAAQRWAMMFREFLDDNLKQEDGDYGAPTLTLCCSDQFNLGPRGVRVVRPCCVDVRGTRLPGTCVP